MRFGSRDGDEKCYYIFEVFLCRRRLNEDHVLRGPYGLGIESGGG